MTEKYHYYLDTVEEDIPDGLFQLVGTTAYSRMHEGPQVKYLLALYLLHNNRHEEALKLLQEVIKAYPLAVNPRLYFVLATIETNAPSDSEYGYYRDFYMYELNFLESNYIAGFLMAYEGLNMIWNKQKLSGIEKCKKAEVLSGDFYPTLLLIARAYGAIGDRKAFEKYYNNIIKTYPRLEHIKKMAFSVKPF